MNTTLGQFQSEANPKDWQTANQYADMFGIPRNIFDALIAHESSWNPFAKPSDGSTAYGYTQLQAGAAQDMGVDRFNTDQNLKGGAMYLSKQYQRFGNWTDALSAYNQGAGKYENPAGKNYAQQILGLAATGDNSAWVPIYGDENAATSGTVGTDGKVVEQTTGVKPDASAGAPSWFAALRDWINSKLGDLFFVLIGVVLIGAVVWSSVQTGAASVGAPT